MLAVVLPLQRVASRASGQVLDPGERVGSGGTGVLGAGEGEVDDDTEPAAGVVGGIAARRLPSACRHRVPPVIVSSSPPPERELAMLVPVSVSAKAEPITFSAASIVSVPAPIVFCAAAVARLTVTPLSAAE